MLVLRSVLITAEKKPLEIKAAVFIKANIFNRNKRIFKIVGNFVDICPIAVFHAGKGRYHISVAVIDVACAVAFRERGNIKRRRGVDICFCNAEHKAESDETAKYSQQQQQVFMTVNTMASKVERGRLRGAKTPCGASALFGEVRFARE